MTRRMRSCWTSLSRRALLLPIAASPAAHGRLGYRPPPRALSCKLRQPRGGAGDAAVGDGVPQAPEHPAARSVARCARRGTGCPSPRTRRRSGSTTLRPDVLLSDVRDRAARTRRTRPRRRAATRARSPTRLCRRRRPPRPRPRRSTRSPSASPTVVTTGSSGPEAVEQPRAEREAALEVVEVRGHSEVRLEQVRRPAARTAPSPRWKKTTRSRRPSSSARATASRAVRISGTCGFGWRRPRNTRRTSSRRARELRDGVDDRQRIEPVPDAAGPEQHAIVLRRSRERRP